MSADPTSTEPRSTEPRSDQPRSDQRAEPMKIAVMSFAHTHAASYVRLLAGMPGVELRASDPDHGDRPEGEKPRPRNATRRAFVRKWWSAKLTEGTRPVDGSGRHG